MLNNCKSVWKIDISKTVNTIYNYLKEKVETFLKLDTLSAKYLHWKVYTRKLKLDINV